MFWDKDIKTLQNKLERLLQTFNDHDKENDRRLDNIEKVLIAQEINLEKHMKRSDHLEDIVELLNARQEEDRKERSKELEPLKKHIHRVEGAFKLIGFLSVGVSIIGGLAKLFGFI